MKANGHFPRALNRDSVIGLFRQIRRESGAISPETLDIMEGIRYSVDVLLSEKPDRQLDFCISHLIITRHWDTAYGDWSTKSWQCGGRTTHLDTIPDGQELILNYQSDERWHSLLAIALLALKAKYDEFRGFHPTGLLFRSELESLKQIGIINPSLSDLDKIVSEVKCSSPGRQVGNDSRRIKKSRLINEFLIDANEIYNLICWVGRKPKDESEAVCGEKIWVLNVLPNDVCVRVGNSVIPNDQTGPLLREMFFPAGTTIADENVSEYLANINSGKGVAFDRRKLPRESAKKRQERLARAGRLLVTVKQQIVDSQGRQFLGQEPAVLWGWKQILEFADDRFGRFGKEEFERRKAEKARYIQERTESLAASNDAGLVARFLRQYYGCVDDERIDKAFYSYRVGDSVIKTHIYAKEGWQDHSCEVADNDDHWRMEGRGIADIAVPKESIVKLGEELVRCGNEVWEHDAYSLCDIVGGQDNPIFVVSMSSYFRYRFSYGLLVDELQQALLDTGMRTNLICEDPWKYVPLREYLLPNINGLARLRPGLCIGGPRVLVAVARPEPDHDFMLLLNERSGTVSALQHVWAVIPAGIHQPFAGTDEEVRLFWTFLRELCEELFGGNELEMDTNRIAHDAFVDDYPPAKWLLDNPGEWTLELLSWGINALAGNYCANLLLVIRDSSYWDEFYKWFKKGRESKKIIRVMSSDEREISKYLTRHDWCHEGLVAFVEGLKRLQELEKDRCKISEIERLTP